MRGSDNAGEFRTVSEMSESSGFNERKVRNLLNFANKSGRLEVRRVAVTGIDGRKTTSPAYRIAEAK